jgi:recombinational DNA repair protein RecR
VIRLACDRRRDTRLAQGAPKGGALELQDEGVLATALAARREDG